MSNVAFSTHHQDCTEYLAGKDDQSTDVIWIDPPYNTKNDKDKTVKYDRNKDFAKKNWTNFHATWDNVKNYYDWALEWAKHARRILKPKGSIFVCGSFHSIPETQLALKAVGFYTIQWIQWCLPNSFPNLQMEKMVNANQTIIWARPYEDTKHYYDVTAAKSYNDGKNLRDYWIIPKESTRKAADKPWLNHPSKKPVALIERALDIALPKQDWVTVLDFFAGSGSFGEAAMNIAKRYNINIHCEQVEKDAEYVQGILARIDYLNSRD